MIDIKEMMTEDIIMMIIGDQMIEDLMVMMIDKEEIMIEEMIDQDTEILMILTKVKDIIDMIDMVIRLNLICQTQLIHLECFHQVTVKTDMKMRVMIEEDTKIEEDIVEEIGLRVL